MKRILFFLSVAVVLAGCGKDKINFKESDLVGTWTHVKSVNGAGTESTDLAESLVFSNDHNLLSYFSSTVFSYKWEMEGRELAYDGITYTIKQLDSRHLTVTYTFNGDTFTDTYIKIEPLLTGTWTVSWTLGDIMYITFNPDGTAVWSYAKTDHIIGKYTWNVGVDEYYSRPAINYSGFGAGQDTIMAAKDDELQVLDNNGHSGIYTRGRLAVQ